MLQAIMRANCRQHHVFRDFKESRFLYTLALRFMSNGSGIVLFEGIACVTQIMSQREIENDQMFYVCK